MTATAAEELAWAHRFLAGEFSSAYAEQGERVALHIPDGGLGTVGPPTVPGEVRVTRLDARGPLLVTDRRVAVLSGFGGPVRELRWDDPAIDRVLAVVGGAALVLPTEAAMGVRAVLSASVLGPGPGGPLPAEWPTWNRVACAWAAAAGRVAEWRRETGSLLGG